MRFPKVTALGHILPIALCVFIASGCASTRPHGETRASAQRFPLLSPASFGQTRQIVQTIEVVFGDESRRLDVAVSITPEQIQLVGLSALGLRLFTLKYDGREATVESNVPLPDELNPNDVLADLQRTYWPEAAFAAAIKNSCWAVNIETSGVRQFHCDDRLETTVTVDPKSPWQYPATLTNHQHGYRLQIAPRNFSQTKAGQQSNGVRAPRRGLRRR